VLLNETNYILVLMIVIHLSTQTSHSMASAKRKKIEHYTKSEYYIK